MLPRLEEAYRRLWEFSSNLAHELRTPISNLITQTEVALSKTRSADQYREVLYSNLEEYERLARMFADMLYLAKVDNRLIVPNSEMVDLMAEARELFDYYEAVAEERGVSLFLVGAGVIRGDRLMIRRALSNLLSNAMEHTLRNRWVRVLIDQRKSGETHLSVENLGEDIKPEHLPRLFDRFHRLDFSRQRAKGGTGGTGLGLAITKSIVDAHEGTIHASSLNGLTCFTVTFPAPAPESALPPSTDCSVARFRSETCHEVSVSDRCDIGPRELMSGGFPDQKGRIEDERGAL